MYNFARYSSGQKATGFGIPAARVIISPDVTLERSADDIRVGGSLTNVRGWG